MHLRVHSAYSLLEGAVKIKQMPALCRTHAMPAIAITDSGNLFGSLEFSETLAGEGIQPIMVAPCSFALINRIAVRRMRCVDRRCATGLRPLCCWRRMRLAIAI